ncbi:MAG: flagellar export chaperone FlgN [Candidatus Zixiibacteriota bacterium]|nr:MAG: flagellar export chaperone FlgN [candidate division Zixibacteria bacterium]
MEPTNQNAITLLEKELVAVLKEEYSFYQSLYVLLDKQRDLIRYEKDDKLLDLFAEVERCHLRIRQSEEKIRALQQKHPRLFKLAAVSPDIRKIVNSIVTLVKKSAALVAENEEYMRNRHDRIKVELDELKNSHKIMQYIQTGTPSAQFVDGKR